MNYLALKSRIKQLAAEGKLPTSLTTEEMADWAYGTCVIENPNVTYEMALEAARQYKSKHHNKL